MKNKKMVLWIALILMTIIPIYAQQYDSEKDFKIDSDDNVKDGVKITGYIGSKREINIPPSIQNKPVTRIEGEAFQNKNFIKVTIPNSVISIGSKAFYNCASLTSVIIPNSVISIEAYAFNGCNSLTSITIPNSVTNIDHSTFSGNKLTTINVDAGNTAYISQDGVLYNKDKTILHTYPIGKIDITFTIPNSVTSVRTSLLSIALWYST